MPFLRKCVRQRQYPNQSYGSQNYSEYIIEINLQGENVEESEFPVLYYVNTTAKSSKPDFSALLLVFNMTWIENGLLH